MTGRGGLEDGEEERHEEGGGEGTNGDRIRSRGEGGAGKEEGVAREGGAGRRRPVAGEIRTLFLPNQDISNCYEEEMEREMNDFSEPSTSPSQHFNSKSI